LNFNLYNSILFAGILQGLLFALVILLNKKYKNKSTLCLAGLIASFSLNNLQFYIADIGLIDSEFFYDYIFTPWCLIIPSFFYLYIAKSLYPEKKTSFRQKLLFVPFFVGFFLSTTYKILIGVDCDKQSVLNVFYGIPNLIEFVAILFNQIVYVVLYFRIRNFEKANSHYNHDTLRIKLTWLRQLIAFLFGLTFIWLYLMLKTVFTDTEVNFYPLWIGISFVTYWLGYVGIYKFGIIEERKKLKRYGEQTQPVYTIVEKQKSSHITAFEQLIVEQKRYRDSDLTLDRIAEELDLSNSYLSRIIKAELGVGFVDYVNTLRVEEAKQYLLNPEFSNYTLVSIGIEAGFNSKSAFYSSFKKITGQTPSDFKKAQQNLS
jgi:AraC-like DNA-binding protein